MSIIEINNLTRDYGNGKGIFQVSFKVEKGQVFGFLGPNGAGKTTTIRHLMGFIKQKDGSCKINGLDCFSNSAEIQKNLGYIPGETYFLPDMTGLEYIKFMAAFRGTKDLTLANELMERFQLDPKGPIRKMSKGMKQKISIVTAFMHNPEILILDEPTSGLDPLMQNEFAKLIYEEKQKSKTILMSSHMMEEVEKTCDQVGIIRNGKIVAIETIENLRSKRVSNFTVTYKNPITKSTEEKVFSVKDYNSFVKEISALDIIQIKQSIESLEEIFLNYYDKNEGRD